MHTQGVRFALLLVILLHCSIPGHAAEPDEYTVFISGFTAFQNQDYKTAVEKMSFFLKEYPATPVRDMALFWLARAHFRLGNRHDAARCIAQFFRENPDTPLRSSVEDELAALAVGYEKDEIVAATAEKPRQAPVPAVTPFSVAAPASPVPRVIGAVPDKKGEPPTVTAGDGKRRKPEFRQVKERYAGIGAAEVTEERLKVLSGEKAAAAKEPARPGSSGKPEKGLHVVTLEVEQSASVELNVPPHPEKYKVGARVSIPFELTNRGNGGDGFRLETGFPGEFAPLFASAVKPEEPITVTPPLTAGEKFRGVLILSIPEAHVDGRKSVFPVKAVSKFDRDVSVSREVSLVSLAPLLRMVLKPDKEQVRPGETVSYRIALLNLGSAAAEGVSFSVTCPSQYEPVESSSHGFRGGEKSVLVSGETAVGPGESREFSLAFRLKDEALAGQELFCRAELINRKPRFRETFLSPAAVVEKVNGVSARTGSDRLTVLPGQRAVIPFTVTNTGNVRESFSLKASAPSGVRYAFFRSGDDASPQSDEPVSGVIGPLAPQEETTVKLEVFAPSDAADGTEAPIEVAVEPEGDREAPASLSARLRFSRPVVELETTGKGGRLKPGEISQLVLGIVNHGSAAARDLEVRSMLPDRLEVVASDPPFDGSQSGERVWRLAELGPGEKRGIVLLFRIKTDVAAGTNLRIENLVRYRDSQGNSY